MLPELIQKHNRLFAVTPKDAESAYRPLPETPLEQIFTYREYRRISSGQTFTWKGKCYMPKPAPGLPRWEPKSVVEVRVGILDGQVWLWEQGRAWACVETPAVETPPKMAPQKEARLAPPRKPGADHPWRKPFSSTYNVAQLRASRQEGSASSLSQASVGTFFGFLDANLKRTFPL
ncbi:MAG: hypothetical protein BAA01_09835 [Bacillus thermozeamaize]|uniref:Uncharacterized protein n=1 Tax=Bacillus thermozeamaize TaxID=230954 RepID=A0A1Y3PJZ5_9BACI|nr:MAG: hypothetical protein BAA01_09835 [Bacillus thermozeamaize]